MRRPPLPRSALVLLATLALAASACDQAQLDEARDAAEQAVEEAASRAEELVDQLPTPLPSPEDLLPAPDDGATQEPSPPATEEEQAAPSPSPVPSPVPAPGPEPVEERPAWLVPLAVVLALALVGALVAARRARERTAQRGRLVDAALRDVGWLLGVADEHRAGVGAEARARDVRLRTDRIGDTLRELAPLVRGERGTLAVSDLGRASARLGDVVVAELDDAAAGRTGADLDRDALAEDVRAAAARVRDEVRTPG